MGLCRSKGSRSTGCQSWRSTKNSAERPGSSPLRPRRTLGQNSKKGSKTSTIHSSNSWIFLSKNPERVDCGGIFISKFFKKNQKLAEINEKSSDPLKRGWSDYGKTHPRWVVMLPSKGIYPLFRGKHLTKGKSKSDFTYFWPFLTLFEWSVEVMKSFLDHTLIWQLF